MTPRFGTGPQCSRAGRAAAAVVITATPANYQVCEGCGSIVAARVQVCPQCRSYRFAADPERVRNTALALGRKRPEPLAYQPLDDCDE
jgi:hypothetical protein